MGRVLSERPLRDAVDGGVEVASEVFDVDAPWRLHPRVAFRAEPFGAMLYHFETRRLTFLKTLVLAGVVRDLDRYPSAGAALTAAGVTAEAHRYYVTALAGLAASSMISRRVGEGGS